MSTCRINPLAAVTVPHEPCTGSAGFGWEAEFGAAEEFGAVCDGIGGTDTLDTPVGSEGGEADIEVTDGGGSSPEQAASVPATAQAANRRHHVPVVVETGKAILSSAGGGRPILTRPGPMPWQCATFDSREAIAPAAPRYARTAQRLSIVDD
ncbi:hypothetical protein P3102_17250 [Amycolatopsis sp. QT-25]|uniref:hypothetical protein n=1 Tax=Amycolatopsis sp. QT-25 TaxID=3034022 RepID=UPI0023EDB53B|nr:hypothetical protein [Amycolatopsis sp. QT-25]WET82824.1 hypothetical protein P3102_17250 [Amycolatopsis sp. QT-25]